VTAFWLPLNNSDDTIPGFISSLIKKYRENTAFSGGG